MDRDEKTGLLLGGLAVAWAVDGLLLLAHAAKWIQDGRAFLPGLDGLATFYLLGAFYLAVFGALALGSLFFTIRGYWQSGDPTAIFVFILEFFLIIPIGRVILWLLDGGR